MNLLIRNENMKIYKRKRTWIMIALVVLFVLLQIVNLKSIGKHLHRRRLEDTAGARKCPLQARSGKTGCAAH